MEVKIRVLFGNRGEVVGGKQVVEMILSSRHLVAKWMPSEEGRLDEMGSFLLCSGRCYYWDEVFVL